VATCRCRPQPGKIRERGPNWTAEPRYWSAEILLLLLLLPPNAGDRHTLRAVADAWTSSRIETNGFKSVLIVPSGAALVIGHILFIKHLQSVFGQPRSDIRHIAGRLSAAPQSSRYRAAATWRMRSATVGRKRGLIDRCRRRSNALSAPYSAQNIIFATRDVAMAAIAAITQKRLVGFITSPRNDVIAWVTSSIKINHRRLTTVVDSFVALITYIPRPRPGAVQSARYFSEIVPVWIRT